MQFTAECAKEPRFDPGHYILREEDEANQFYLIQRGSVALDTFVFGRGFTTIQTFDNGQILEWSWLIPPHGRRIRQKCKEDHDFGYEIMKRLALTVGDRLRATRLRLSP